MDEVRWLDEREQRAWRGLQLMQMQLIAELAHQLATESGLSYSDYVVLVALTDQTEGRLRVFELGQILGWEKSRVSHQVARMVERGLVEKAECELDRRGAYVVVTRQGRQAIEQAAPGHVRAVRRLFIDQLTARELDSIAGVAEKVLAAFDGSERGRSSAG